MIEHLNYLFSIIIFAGTATLIVWHKRTRLLKKYEVVLVFLVSVSVPFASTEYFALKWRAWFYYPLHTLNLQYLAEVESYIFAMFVTLFCASVTIIYALKVDKKADLYARKRSHKRRSSRLRRLVPVAGATRR